MNNLEPPPIPKPLIEWLEKCFPPKDFKRGVTLDEVNRYGGTRDLVVVLRAHFDRQTQPK